MMFVHKTTIDERTSSMTRQIAALWLGLTQVMLAGVIFYRLYVLGQPDAEIRDFSIVLAFSLFGHLAFQLFFSSTLPQLTWKGIVTAYALLTGLIVVVSVAIHGWPAPEEWAVTWLPALLGPAILVGAYVALARLGQWRLEREIRLLED
jgi:phosphoglycerol transferase MdoB-like AlkP superfamily enzyme